MDEVWDFDPLGTMVKDLRVQLQPSELIPNGIEYSTFSRDDDFNIILSVQTGVESFPYVQPRRLGTVHILDNKIDLIGGTGWGTAEGLTHSLTSVQRKNGRSIAELTYKIEQINYTVRDVPAHYTVDRIANLPTNFIWPDSSSSVDSGLHERTFSGFKEITIKTPKPRTDRSNRHSAMLDFGDHTVIISQIISSLIPEHRRPGFIYYSGQPDSKTRAKIRDSLSFALGLPLVHVGTNFYAESGGILGFQAVTPSTIGGRAWSLASMPFSPITIPETNLLASDKLQKISKAFYEHYDPLNLDRISFRLWHAEVSPSYMKPAYYGAMIESIQKQEAEKLESKLSSTVIPKADYRKTMNTLTRYIERQNIPDEAKKIFIQKISNGNSAPQKIVAERFYGALGLFLGDKEREAWDRRNDAAHGNYRSLEDRIRDFRSTKILRVILGRIIMQLINGGDQYVDYYTLGHPSRPLSDSIPADVD